MVVWIPIITLSKGFLRSGTLRIPNHTNQKYQVYHQLIQPETYAENTVAISLKLTYPVKIGRAPKGWPIVFQSSFLQLRKCEFQGSGMITCAQFEPPSTRRHTNYKPLLNFTQAVRGTTFSGARVARDYLNFRCVLVVTMCPWILSANDQPSYISSGHLQGHPIPRPV